MGKILLIEDEGMLARKLENELNMQHEVKKAYSYASATGLWRKYEEKFDCIILDFNIEPHGLDEINLDKYFPIQGISFLIEICKDKTPEESIQIWNKTIIYSGYINVLRNKKNDLHYFNYLHLIPKQKDSIVRLLNKVHEIVKNINT